MALPPEPPEEQQPPPPPTPGDEGGECPRCGTPYEPFQEYCLECGLRLPANRGLIPVLSTAWRKRVPWYPGDWVWPVIGLLIIAVLAGAIAILANTDNESATKTQAATGESIPAGTGTVGSPPPPTETSPTETSTLPTEPPPPPPPPANEIIEWPAGQNGWTIVLASVPTSSGRATANRTARNALNLGLTDVGVLDSSEFSSLQPGYFVVFSGIYSSESEAESAESTAKSSFPQAYVRQITQ